VGMTMHATKQTALAGPRRHWHRVLETTRSRIVVGITGFTKGAIIFRMTTQSKTDKLLRQAPLCTQRDKSAKYSWCGYRNWNIGYW
jgi:hypothetical protein